MFGRGEPGLHGVTKRVARHPGMGERQDLHQAIEVVAFQEFGKIAGQGGLHHWIGGKRGLNKDAALQFVDGKGCLKRHRILRPETAVVIKHGDAFCPWQEVGGSSCCHPGDEGEDLPFSGAIVPGG